MLPAAWDIWDAYKNSSTGCPKHETSSPAPLLTGSVLRPNLVSEQTLFCLDPRRTVFGLRLSESFLHTRFYSAMNGWVILRRPRIVLLSFLALICLTWAILFAIFLHHDWSYSSPFQKIVIVGLLSLFVFTAILFYLMAVVHYCPWWDVVRMFAILVVHIGSSMLFTHNRPNFPCLGFGKETACKEFLFTIFVGCWVFSVTTLCFAIALIVMAFIPQPVESARVNPGPIQSPRAAALESLPPAGTEEDDLPSNPDWFKAGGQMADERRTPLSSSRTGLVTYDNELQEESLSPDRNVSPVNSIHGVVIPRPESLQGTENDDLPSNPGWSIAGNPTADERRTFLPSTRTGLVTYNNELQEKSSSPDHNASSVNSIHRETIALERLHAWQNFEIRNSRHSNETGSHGGTISLRNTSNTSGGGTSIGSGSLHVGAFGPNSFHDSSTLRVSIYLRSQISLNYSRMPYRQSLTVTPPPS